MLGMAVLMVIDWVLMMAKHHECKSGMRGYRIADKVR
jgi:hypothetical protein